MVMARMLAHFLCDQSPWAGSLTSQVRRVSLATWRLHFAGVDIEVISHASALVAVCAMGSPSRGHSRDRRPIAAANYIDAKRNP